VDTVKLEDLQIRGLGFFANPLAEGSNLALAGGENQRGTAVEGAVPACSRKSSSPENAEFYFFGFPLSQEGQPLSLTVSTRPIPYNL